MFLLFALSTDSAFEANIREAKSLMTDSLESAIEQAHTAEDYATTKNQLGRVYWMLGSLYERNHRPTNAANYYYGAAKIYESDGDYLNAARLLENIGTLALNSRYPEMALRAYSKSLEAVRKADHYQLEARVLYDMSLAYIMHARYDLANETLMNALKVLRLRGNVPDDWDTYAKIYNELGVVNKFIAYDFQEPDLYDTAMAHYQTAVSWSTSRVTTYRPLNNIGNVWLAKGQIDSAESYFKKALKMGEDLGSLIIPSVNNLAKIHFQRGDYTGADSLFRRAIALNLANLDKVNKGVAIGMNNVTELDISYTYLDSLNNYLPSDNRVLLAKLQELHRTQKHLEALELRKQIELQEARFNEEVAAVIRKENIQRWVERAGLGLLLIASVTALVWYVLQIKARRRAVASEIRRIESQYSEV